MPADSTGDLPTYSGMLREAARFTAANPLRLLRCAAVPVAVQISLVVASSELSGAFFSGILFGSLYDLLSWLVWSWFSFLWYRELLLGPRPAPLLLRADSGKLLRYLSIAAMFGIATFATSRVAAYGILIWGPALGPDGAQWVLPAFLVAYMTADILIFPFLIRWAMTLVATVTGQWIPLSESWRATRPVWMPYLMTLLTLSLPFRAVWIWHQLGMADGSIPNLGETLEVYIPMLLLGMVASAISNGCDVEVLKWVNRERERNRISVF